MSHNLIKDKQAFGSCAVQHDCVGKVERLISERTIRKYMILHIYESPILTRKVK